MQLLESSVSTDKGKTQKKLFASKGERQVRGEMLDKVIFGTIRLPSQESQTLNERCERAKPSPHTPKLPSPSFRPFR